MTLFGDPALQQDLTTLRGHALVVMRRLAPFEPVLFGAIVDGTASAHSRINLCVFLDTVEELLIYLINENIPFNVGEMKVRFNRQSTRATPMVEFIAGDADVRILILPPRQRQLPIDALSGERYRRMTLAQLQNTVDADARLKAAK
ncbi:MAG: hypothetical protein HKM24_02575 [Gammaproteobacteria bacterium]|nr:hypothetical protein [Gammaproteobacteria bacterium]